MNTYGWAALSNTVEHSLWEISLLERLIHSHFSYSVLAVQSFIFEQLYLCLSFFRRGFRTALLVAAILILVSCSVGITLLLGSPFFSQWHLCCLCSLSLNVKSTQDLASFHSHGNPQLMLLYSCELRTHTKIVMEAAQQSQRQWAAYGYLAMVHGY